ncbi:hypothetical protein [Fortiea contorta]|uniref:hypothetical protein n=1 Tax=Fortiea contorta TaxID=1892405 RepID=UPI000345A56D|nr:hypothetical protein [Fortiea contorta]
MFYIQIVDRRWEKPESSVNRVPPIPQPLEIEAQTKKSLQLAKAKTTDYIRNIQQVYYLERRSFS